MFKSEIGLVLSDVVMKDSIIPSMTQEPEAKHLFVEISEKDWEDFLLSRAKELVPGEFALYIITILYLVNINFLTQLFLE